MHFFAITYPCGLAMHADSGQRYGTYNSFPSRDSRDSWVDGGAGYQNAKDWREAIQASDPELRALRRREISEGYSLIRTEDERAEDSVQQKELEDEWDAIGKEVVAV